MPVEFSIDVGTVVYGLAGAGVATIAWFAQRNLNRIETDVSLKADRDHMEREVESLRVELKEARDARERDNERIERASAEKFSEFASAMRDRINVMERNVDDRIVAMREDVGQKLDLILQMVKK